MIAEKRQTKYERLKDTVLTAKALGMVIVGMCGCLAFIGAFTAAVFAALTQGKIDLFQAVMIQVVGIWFFTTSIIIAKA